MRRLVAVFYFPCFLSLFTEDFATFIEDNYGENFLDLLQRKDLGDKGSFGGKTASDDEILHDPVIFIHGVSDTAGERMKSFADKFIEIGYVEGELYATTYSHGARGNPISWTQYSMRCEYVKQIRALILAVRYYTGKDVDIVAYSLGVPIARKAILGGFCVDTDEELGGPLTKYVDSFVGIAGPNHGIALKVVGLPIPACVLGAPPICDRVIGLYSGLCPLESMFLNDINKKEHYEGRHVFSIYSQSDNMVGYKVCGKITATIPGEDGHKVFPNLDHDEVLTNAVDSLFTVIQNHSTFPLFRRPVGPKTTFRLNRRKEEKEKHLKRKSDSSKETTKAPLVSTTKHSSETTTADVVRSLEAIFTDTKESALQNIRNFFRQKFADEEVSSKEGFASSGSSREIRGRPVPDPKNSNEEKAKGDSHQKQEGSGYHRYEEINQVNARKVGSRESIQSENGIGNRGNGHHFVGKDDSDLTRNFHNQQSSSVEKWGVGKGGESWQSKGSQSSGSTKNEIVPFMSSSRTEDRTGYLTRVRLQFDGCCDQ